MTNHKHYLEAIKRFIPPLSHALHKGQSGRVGVIGGCEEYTGAPYFSSITALKLGADLSHVICDKNAATAIKSYSPELIVHPYLRTKESSHADPISDAEIIDNVKTLLSRLHMLIIGPGMGRDERMITNVTKIISEAKKANLPMVIDADGLYLVMNNPAVIQSYKHAILTPNRAEFNRLCQTFDIPATPSSLSTFLNVTVLLKGATDTATYKDLSIECTTSGSPRRFGGQGDVLSGAIGVFWCWSRLFGNVVGTDKQLTDKDREGIEDWNRLLACWAGCHITKTASMSAFRKKRRSAGTVDVIDALQLAMEKFD